MLWSPDIAVYKIKICQLQSSEDLNWDTSINIEIAPLQVMSSSKYLQNPAPVRALLERRCSADHQWDLY